MPTAFWRKRSDGRKTVLMVRWRNRITGEREEETRPTDRTKAQALEYARDRERETDRIAKGLAVDFKPVRFGVLMDSWWRHVGSRRRSKQKADYLGFLMKHLGGLRDVVLTPATAGDFAAQVEGILRAREEAGELAAQSLNHLRAGVHGMFEHGLDPKYRLWTGENPMKWVERRRVPKTEKPTLKRHEIQAVIDAFPEPDLHAPWRWAAAIMIYTGARPGEVLGARKSDVDLEEGVFFIRHSWTTPIPKDNEPREALIVPELRPYLLAAIAAAPAHELLLPRPDGRPHEEHLRKKLVLELRRAICTAGLKHPALLEGFEHTCRRCKGVELRRKAAEDVARERQRLAGESVSAPGREAIYRWTHPDFDQRRCPACGMKLWAKAMPRPLRFYDLRHTHVTVLRRAKVDRGAVSAQVGHSSEEMTERYDHSELEVHRKEITAALTFKPGSPGGAPKAARGSAEKNEGPVVAATARDNEAFRKSGREDSNLRPLAPQAGPATSHPAQGTYEGQRPQDTGTSGTGGSPPDPRHPPTAVGAGSPGGAPTSLRRRLELLQARYARVA